MYTAPTLSVVSIDNQAGASKAVSHLVELGCLTVGSITGPLDWWESQGRLAGWRAVLEQAGLDTDSLMETRLNQRPDLDAVFACNDSIVLGVIHTACRRGLSIQDDLLLVGYDNTPEAASYWPPLTSVRQDLLQSGQIAVEELHQIIEAGINEQKAPASISSNLD